MIFRSPFSLLAALFLLATSAPIHAKLFIIYDTQDSTNNTNLRGAIIEANRRHGHHDIVLVQTNYQLSLSGPFEDAARAGDLDITASITISGMPGHQTIIDASALYDRVFEVFPRAQLNLQNLTIIGGTGAARYHLTRDEHGNFVFHPNDLGIGGGIYNNGSLSLKHCLLTNNTSAAGLIPSGNSGPDPAADGGAIYNANTLLMEDCVIADNHTGSGAPSGSGAGIFNTRLAILNRCILIRNKCSDGSHYSSIFGFGASGGNGGGICNLGRILLNDCTVSENTSGSGYPGTQPGNINNFCSGGPGGAAGDGAGLYNTGTLTLNRCALSKNACGHGGDGASCTSGGTGGSGGNGAGIFNSGNLTLNTCTVSANTAGYGGNGGFSTLFTPPSGGPGGCGAGLYNSGKALVTSSTICLNIAGAAGTNAPGAPGIGGGIASASTPPTTILRNSLIALNAASSDIAKEVSGHFISQGYNLIGAFDGSVGFTNGFHHDLVGSEASYLDPLLLPLQNNGGPTLTHALSPSSPAIDQGKRFDSTTDQRGKKRPSNFSSIPNAPGGDGTDIGAFELIP